MNIEKKGKDITVCSVSFNSSQFFELNSELILKLNDHTLYDWIIVENTPFGNEDQLNYSDSRFQIVEGVRKNINEHWAPDSLHHSQGLNIALKHVNTRYLVVMDPDFFIVLNDWMKIIPSFMEMNNISIFGAPWNPQWIFKYRYFPSPHFSFYDLNNIPLKSLDFLPGDSRFTPKKNYYLSRFSKNNERLWINCQPDTGWRIYKKFIDSNKVLYFCIKPCFNPTKYRLYNKLKLKDRILDLLFPDSWSYIPKKEKYFSKNFFKDYDYPDTTTFGCEEFIWNNKPFGFHFRGYRNNENFIERKNEIRDIIYQFSD
tara:strand:- start:646 stop:1587 length:942 start_codon:yes stop_codon:yes gene_type:complete